MIIPLTPLSSHSWFSCLSDHPQLTLFMGRVLVYLKSFHMESILCPSLSFLQVCAFPTFTVSFWRRVWKLFYLKWRACICCRFHSNASLLVLSLLTFYFSLNDDLIWWLQRNNNDTNTFSHWEKFIETASWCISR